MDYLKLAIERIENQQPKERSAVWMVGEQLKDILRREPHQAELVYQDLEQKQLSLANCEKKIKAYADQHKTGNFSCVIPSEAEKIIREFYGMANEQPARSVKRSGSDDLIDLSDFF